MVVRRKDTSKTKHYQTIACLAKTYLEDEEGAKLLVITNRLKNNIGALIAQIKKLERTVECIENYVEEKTGVELGKELIDSFESSSTEETIIVMEESEDPIQIMHHAKRLSFQKRRLCI